MTGSKARSRKARMMKLVDIPDLKSGALRRAGSIPAPGTNTLRAVQRTALAQTCSGAEKPVVPALEPMNFG